MHETGSSPIYVLLERHLPRTILDVLLVGLQNTLLDSFPILFMIIYRRINLLLSQHSDEVLLYGLEYLFLSIVERWWILAMT